jgi:hypothetical protein
MNKPSITTQAELRAAFWHGSEYGRKPAKYRGKSQNDLPADIRVAWVEYVDYMQKSGAISEALARRVTL